jgi:hypothetical protein
MSDPIAPLGQDGVRAAIQRAAAATGVDFSLLVRTAERESSLNPQARAATSSALGAFQFIASTWLDMVRRHGAQHGLGQYAAALQGGNVDAATRSAILALRTDPEISARMAAELTRENAQALQSQLGRAPTAGELYAAHVLGPEGAAKLIAAAGAGVGDAASILPREAGVNHGLFNAEGVPLSAQGLLDRFSRDADASLTTPATRGAVASTPGAEAMSPALAQVLFNLSMLPLLAGDEDAGNADPVGALMAYTRADRI